MTCFERSPRIGTKRKKVERPGRVAWLLLAAGLGCLPPRSMREAVSTDVDTPVPPISKEPGPARVVVRAPAPGREAPLNLATIAVALVPPPAAAPERLVLVSSDAPSARVVAMVEASAADGLLLARLPRFEGPCAPLCPSTRYRIELADIPASRSFSAESEIAISSEVDRIAPKITSSTILVQGGRVRVEIAATKAIIARGAAQRVGGDWEALDFPLIASSTVVAEPKQALAPDTDYALRVEVEDLAGNSLAPLNFAVRTPPRIEITINELVPVPFHVWSHGDGAGPPFGPHPGTGSVTSADQWVELVNHSSRAIDLRTAGLVLWTIGRAPKQTILSHTRDLYFGNGGSPEHWGPGEALVFHPKGTMSSRGFVLELTMRDQPLDRISVGGMSDAVARSTSPPDTVHESLARDAAGRFHWCIPNPGDPLPPRQCVR